jgi:hypothetical protein
MKRLPRGWIDKRDQPASGNIDGRPRRTNSSPQLDKVEALREGAIFWDYRGSAVKITRNAFSMAVTVAAAVVVLAALPSAIRDTFETGRAYLFSRQFLEELPQRFTGPGRFRFVVQPLVAVLLGWRGGRVDARTGRTPYLYELLILGKNRKALLRRGFADVRDLLCLGIILDAVAQLLIYREVHPGAALLIGPVFICIPYALARALANRAIRLTHRAPHVERDEA